MSSLQFFCPAPLRYLLFASNAKVVHFSLSSADLSGGFTAGAGISQKQRAASISRIALAIIATSVASLFPHTLLIMAALGLAFARPTLAIVVGTGLTFLGASAVIGALASGSLAAFAAGSAAVAAGWITLETHDWKLLPDTELFIGK